MSNLPAVLIFVPVPVVPNIHLPVSQFETLAPSFWKEMKILPSGTSKQFAFSSDISDFLHILIASPSQSAVSPVCFESFWVPCVLKGRAQVLWQGGHTDTATVTPVQEQSSAFFWAGICAGSSAGGQSCPGTKGHCSRTQMNDKHMLKRPR